MFAFVLSDNKSRRRRRISTGSCIGTPALVLLSFLRFTERYWVLLDFTGFYWVLLGFTGLYWVVNQVLLGFTWFDWV